MRDQVAEGEGEGNRKRQGHVCMCSACGREQQYGYVFVWMWRGCSCVGIGAFAFMGASEAHPCVVAEHAHLMPVADGLREWRRAISVLSQQHGMQ
jgi:hypothetical protein